MAESPLEQATRTYEGGPPRAVESALDLTSSNRTQTRGGYITRRRQRFETMLYFSTQGRRTSTRLAILWTCVRFPNRSAQLRRRVADDTRLTTHEGTPDLGLSQIFKDFVTSTQSSQTRGAYFPRPQKDYETQSFSEKNPTGRRSSTSPWRSHPSSRRLALTREVHHGQWNPP